MLVIRVWLPPTFDGIDPEQFVSKRHVARVTTPSESKMGSIQDEYLASDQSVVHH
ncbi:MAG: hypothetical protein F6K24_53850 [Okeania sp. SIO2D1]|nr:hypothetical protein [Okeania sp. SIO2D1]